MNNDTIKAILGGIAIALVLFLVVTLAYFLCSEILGFFAGFFFWIIIKLITLE